MTAAPLVVADADAAGRLPVGSVVAAINLDDPRRPAVAHKMELNAVTGDGVGPMILWRMLDSDEFFTTEDLWPAEGEQLTSTGSRVHSVVLLWRPEWAVLLVRPHWADNLELSNAPAGDYKRPAQRMDRPLRPDTGDSRSLPCVRCGVTTPDASFVNGLPVCDNCAPLVEVWDDEPGEADE